MRMSGLGAATADMLRSWTAGTTGLVEGTTVDPAEVIAEAERRADEARARAGLVVETFLSGVLTGHPVPAGR